MKILVTGGTGRIGANLVKGLLAKGHEIRSFVYPGTGAGHISSMALSGLKRWKATSATSRT